MFATLLSSDTPQTPIQVIATLYQSDRDLNFSLFDHMFFIACFISCVVRIEVEDQMKLLENCWSELLLLDVLYKQLEHSDTHQLLMVTAFVP